jgi:hypothetical protein
VARNVNVISAYLLRETEYLCICGVFLNFYAIIILITAKLVLFFVQAVYIFSRCDTFVERVRLVHGVFNISCLSL